MADLVFQADNSRIGGAGRDLSLSSHNKINNVMHNYQYFSTDTEEVRADPMVSFLRRHSKNYRVSYDSVLALRAPGTGQWFLNSEEYLAWKRGDLLNLACVGIPGAGKTVMSAIVIEDLMFSYPLSPIIYIFNEATSQNMQTPEILMANMLSQVLDQNPGLSSLERPRDLYKAYRSVEADPPFERCKDTFLQLAERLPQPVFVVIDALDEYQIGNVSASMALVQDLEDLDASLLITSRNTIPFSEDSYYNLDIQASDHDIHTAAARALKRSAVGTVLRQRGLLDEMATRITTQARGIFLSSTLILSSISSCHTVAAARQLVNTSSNLSNIYQVMFAGIRQRSPWVLPLIYYLLFPEQCRMEHAAMLHYLACEDWNTEEESIEDYTRSAETVLEACRGLIVLVQQWPEEEQEFQFCHLTVREYVQSAISTEELANARLAFIHTILRYSLRTMNYLDMHFPLATVYTHQSYFGHFEFELTDHAVTPALLKVYHPLFDYHSLWFAHASGLEDRIEASDVYACYEHPRLYAHFDAFGQLSLLRRAKYDDVGRIGREYFLSQLCQHGLGVLLKGLLARNLTYPLDQEHMGSRTGLFLAISHGQVNVVRILLEAGAASDEADEQDETPTTIASSLGHRDILELLIDHGASLQPVTGKRGKSPLLSAVHANAVHIAELLIERGAPLDSTDEEGRMPLSYALKQGYCKMAKLLIDKGAPPDSADNFGWTPLIWACRKGQLDIAKLLIATGARLDSADKVGWTPLTYASASGHLDVVRLLIERGGRALIDSAHLSGSTPTMVALRRGHLAIARLLIEKSGR